MPAVSKKPNRAASAGQGRRSFETRIPKLQDMRTMAEERGLFEGKTQMLRGRIPETLVRAARENSGIESDTELLKTGLAKLAVEDDYADWLFRRRGRLPSDLDFDV
jgi:hypothetical protein